MHTVKIVARILIINVVFLVALIAGGHLISYLIGMV